MIEEPERWFIHRKPRCLVLESLHEALDFQVSAPNLSATEHLYWNWNKSIAKDGRFCGSA